MKRLNEAFLVAAMGVFATSSHAAFFNNATGLANPEQTIDFESVALAANQPVTTEFQSLGVTFSTAFANPDLSDLYPNISGNRIGNFQNFNGQSGLFTMNFTDKLSEVAFAIVTAPGGLSTFQALLNGTVLETATQSTTTTDSANFFGFRDLVFDQITISTVSSDRALLLDNLQTVTAVPEPASWELLLGGLAALGGLARRGTPRQTCATRIS